MITEDYVSFETAKLLKEKGFNWKVHYVYHSYKQPFFHRNLKDFNGEEYKNLKYEWCSAPTLQMAMKWFREVHNIGIFPTTFYRHTETFDGHNYGCTLVNLKTFDVIGNFEDCTFPADSYEETCEAAIKYCLKNLI